MLDLTDDIYQQRKSDVLEKLAEKYPPTYVFYITNKYDLIQAQEWLRPVLESFELLWPNADADESQTATLEAYTSWALFLHVSEREARERVAKLKKALKGARLSSDDEETTSEDEAAQKPAKRPHLMNGRTQLWVRPTAEELEARKRDLAEKAVKLGIKQQDLQLEN